MFFEDCGMESKGAARRAVCLLLEMRARCLPSGISSRPLSVAMIAVGSDETRSQDLLEI